MCCLEMECKMPFFHPVVFYCYSKKFGCLRRSSNGKNKHRLGIILRQDQKYLINKYKLLQESIAYPVLVTASILFLKKLTIPPRGVSASVWLSISSLYLHFDWQAWDVVVASVCLKPFFLFAVFYCCQWIRLFLIKQNFLNFKKIFPTAHIYYCSLWVENLRGKFQKKAVKKYEWKMSLDTNSFEQCWILRGEPLRETCWK